MEGTEMWGYIDEGRITATETKSNNLLGTGHTLLGVIPPPESVTGISIVSVT